MKIIAVGMNYAPHVQEMGHAEVPAEPVIFLKPDTALLRTGWPFFVPDFSQEVHYEAEVVVRICRLGRSIAERFAQRYYDAVSVGIDFTARDLQRELRAKGLPWELSKAFDGSAAVGQFVPLEELGGDVQRLDFSLSIDGREVQCGHTADMTHTVDQIISYASQYFTLRTGDLIYTGTPAGVGPVCPEQHLEGFLQGRKVLDFHIK